MSSPADGTAEARRTPQLWVVALCLGFVLAIGYLGLWATDRPQAEYVLTLVIAVFTFVGTFLGLRLHKPSYPLPWQCLLGAFGLGIVGATIDVGVVMWGFRALDW